MVDPFADFFVCLIKPQCADPALDIMKIDIGKYSITRDASLLVTKEGQSPWKFAVAKIDWKYVAQQISTLASDDQKAVLAFRAACKLIKRPDGTTWEPKALTEGPNGVMLAAPSWADEVADECGPHAVLEVGTVARQFALLKKGQQGPFFSQGG